MAVFKPFKAVRPVAEKAKEIASLPYDVMDSEEARIEVQKHPLSFIHVKNRRLTCRWELISMTLQFMPKPKKTCTNISATDL